MLFACISRVPNWPTPPLKLYSRNLTLEMLHRHVRHGCHGREPFDGQERDARSLWGTGFSKVVLIDRGGQPRGQRDAVEEAATLVPRAEHQPLVGVGRTFDCFYRVGYERDAIGDGRDVRVLVTIFA